MDFIFIRHGHGEHLIDYPNRLNTLHPSLTEYGKFQVTQLRNDTIIDPDDLVLVSPTKRTIETAAILKNDLDFVISPFVGPRMFPQNPDLPFLACDHILSKTEIRNLYGDIEILDFNLECWKEGINQIEQYIFEGYAKRLIAWIGERYKTIFMISHDGTITNYRILLGEKGLTRKDFLGEAGVYRLKL
ncbi:MULTISPECIES: histidine phosphatase family protein [Paenibacillus]|uniref:Phosphoglycerate mutase n=2 Tax=Paenibacillus lactis TaxID=228574 RepID=G4HBT3_9BACL|nr:histidine phosphatase family protein [Paenibacillus lactis]EHB66614.1 Phosphoglycerate mutase [Paenibacillus lactis 154]MBP1896975.1 broad specificity phosphatase PhoE [Paenibacillus lactis]